MDWAVHVPAGPAETFVERAAASGATTFDPSAGEHRLNAVTDINEIDALAMGQKQYEAAMKGVAAALKACDFFTGAVEGVLSGCKDKDMPPALSIHIVQLENRSK